MAEAYIIDAVHTPVGRRGGGLSTVHSADLGAHVLKALMERNPSLDPAAIADVMPSIASNRSSTSSEASGLLVSDIALGSTGLLTPSSTLPINWLASSIHASGWNIDPARVLPMIFSSVSGVWTAKSVRVWIPASLSLWAKTRPIP